MPLGPAVRESILRKLVWDMHHPNDAPAALTLMGLAWGTHDSMIDECISAQIRGSALYPIDEGLHELCGLAAEVAMRTTLGHRGDPQDLLGGQFPHVIETTTRAVIGYLLAGNSLRY